MRVLVTSRLYVSNAAPGRGTFVHNLTRFLGPHCELQVVSPTPWAPVLPGCGRSGRWSTYRHIGQQEHHDGLTVSYPRYLSLPGRLLFSQAWRAYLAALARAAPVRPDLIHAHLAYPDGYAAARRAARWGVPLVISVHGHDVRELPQARRRWRALVATALQRADRVLVSSSDIHQRVLQLGGAPAAIRRIPQGVDTELFSLAPPRAAARTDWRLLYVGRFDPRKGIGILLESTALLRGAGRHVRLRLVGGSPVSGTEAAFRQQAAALGLADCVEFVGAKPWAAVAAEMAAADLLVLPSFYDSFGIVLIEAMACGRPVVATRCGGPEGIVTDTTGVLVPVGDAVALAAGIGQVLDQYGQYDGATIRRHAQENYDYRQLAARVAAVYSELQSV